MRITCQWSEAEFRDAPELSASSGWLGIEVGGENVSRIFFHSSRKEQDRIAMPAYPLAQGLAQAWWWLKAGRSGTLCLRDFREGFAVPDVTLEPDGQNFTISSVPCHYENPELSFRVRATEQVNKENALEIVDAFIINVITRLTEKRISGDFLQRRWDEIQSCLADPDSRAFCEAAGAMGLDPYFCDERETALILEAHRFFQQDALAEFLASRDVQAVSTDLDWLRTQEDQKRLVDLPDLAHWAPEIRQDLSGAAPWERGYAAARDLRARHDLSEDTILSDMNTLRHLCGNITPPVGRGRGKNIRANLAVANDAPKVVVGELGMETSRIFAFARAIGDFILFGTPGHIPIMETRSYRQACGRAFAAELLAPMQRVAAMAEDGWTNDDIAAELRVSETLIEKQRENWTRLHAA